MKSWYIQVYIGSEEKVEKEIKIWLVHCSCLNWRLWLPCDDVDVDVNDQPLVAPFAALWDANANWNVKVGDLYRELEDSEAEGATSSVFSTLFFLTTK